MATQSSSKSIDLQKIISGAAELEVKALLAGVEYMQVWISQAGKLASIASDTLQAIQRDKESLGETARRLTEFGKQNAEIFGDLSRRMTNRYYSELDRLVTAGDAKAGRTGPPGGFVARLAPAKKAARRKPMAKKKAAKKA